MKRANRGPAQAKRNQDQEAIFRKYGRNTAGHAVPQIVVVRGGMALREVESLVRRLRGGLELRTEDRARIATAIENCLAGKSFEQAFGLTKPAHRPSSRRTYFQAAEYLLRCELGESPPSSVYKTVADRWSVGADSVKSAVSKHGADVKEWIQGKVADHERSFVVIAPEVSDRDSALRTLILLVDHEIGPDDAPYLAAVGR